MAKPTSFLGKKRFYKRYPLYRTSYRKLGSGPKCSDYLPVKLETYERCILSSTGSLTMGATGSAALFYKTLYALYTQCSGRSNFEAMYNYVRLYGVKLIVFGAQKQSSTKMNIAYRFGINTDIINGEPSYESVPFRWGRTIDCSSANYAGVSKFWRIPKVNGGVPFTQDYVKIVPGTPTPIGGYFGFSNGYGACSTADYGTGYEGPIFDVRIILYCRYRQKNAAQS